ncbi:MAG TPA: ribonuclease HI [Anaerolineae bacterium]|nr:ribonuclease HI [Anaerolineae bacterium]HQI86973.1 ribonuclease HI [Anaerolineae bacterium]
MAMQKHVTIYTDGSAIGNPGPGGYGAVLRFGEHSQELAGGFRRTTNNRMEILAAIEALRALKEPCTVTLHTDSRYLTDAITQGWVKRWQAKGWMRTKDEKALNVDLWLELLPLLEKHNVTFVWVRGHVGNPDNERCDMLAREAATQPNLPPDKVYEAEHKVRSATPR